MTHRTGTPANCSGRGRPDGILSAYLTHPSGAESA